MRGIVRAGTLAVCGGLSLLASCGDDGDPTGGDPLLPVIERARAASNEYGSRYTMRGRVTADGTTFALRGYGQTEAGAKRLRVVTTAGGETFEVVQGGPFLYQRVDQLPPTATKLLPRGVRWLKIDQDTALDAAGLGAAGKLQTSGPVEVLTLVARLDPKIEGAGAERIDGALLRRYRITVPSRRVFETLAEGDVDDLPASVKPLMNGTYTTVLWIDAKHLVRRSRVRFEGAAQSFVVTSDVTAFVRDLRVDVPSRPTVYDATDVVTQAFDENP